MGNMTIYDAVREVPKNAQKEIAAGRLKGKTDINPMWRIKELTEQFGPCGIGWGYTIDKQWLEVGANDEVSAFCNISLWVKVDGVKSEPIVGTGGSAFVAKEKNGPYTSDECYKMALTDAISVACKALGFGADIYWSADRTKYDKKDTEKTASTHTTPPPIKCSDCGFDITPVRQGNKEYSALQIANNTKASYGDCLCWKCATKRKAEG